MTDSPVTVHIKIQNDKKHSMVLGDVTEDYFYFHLFVYVAMVNRTYSNISFKKCQQVCALIKTPYNKKIPSLHVSFHAVYVESRMAWYGTRIFIPCVAAAERKPSVC